MLYVILAEDAPGALDRRLAARPQHLAHLDGLGDSLLLAGPFVDAAGNPVGSMVVIEAADQAEAEAMANADPFAQQGIFSSVVVRPWKWSVKTPEGR